MSKRPAGYVASPYTAGDPCINTNFQMRVFDQLISDGIVLPYMPLWSHFQHTSFPRSYDDWIAYDNDMIAALDLKWILRLNAYESVTDYHESKSSGADNEVKLVEELYPDAIVIVQRSDEEYNDAIQRLYRELDFGLEDL
jgi:hypothetical protein